MRFVCYDDLDAGEAAQLGIDSFGVVYNLQAVIQQMAAIQGVEAPPMPDSIFAFHALSTDDKASLAGLVELLHTLEAGQRGDLIRRNIRRLSPLPQPASIRCFSAFEAHTKTLRQRRGLTMPTEWYDAPLFFYGNASAVYGPGAEVPQPASFWLDYELQVACVIGKQGKNIRTEEADAFIAGYTIMNDWCARDLEMYEMRMGYSPTKGRDFAVSLGPTLVTPDELEGHAIGEGAERRYDLRMEASVNGRLLSSAWGNLRTIYFTFPQMIERASADVTLYPGDIFGSGAVSSGSLLDIGAEETLGRWLQPGDVIDLEVELLGVLRNTIVEPRM